MVIEVFDLHSDLSWPLGEPLSEIAITIPCYNETDRLECEAFIGFVRWYRHGKFILVNDRSTDGTERLLRKMSEIEVDNFRVISLEKNRGKAEAVRQGTVIAIGISCEICRILGCGFGDM